MMSVGIVVKAVAKAWSGPRFLSALAVAAATWIAIPSAPVAVPGRDGVESLLWPLTPVVPALAVPLVAVCAYRDLELASARSRPGSRLAVATALVASQAVVCLLAPDPLIAVRNSAALTGLALLCVSALRPALGWLPAVAVPMAMWLFGTRVGGTVTDWAVLLHPRQSATGLVSAAGMTLLGVGVYCRRRA